MRWKWALRKVFLIFSVFLVLISLVSVVFNTLKADNEDLDYDQIDPFDAHKNEIFVKEYLKLMQLNRAPVRPVVEKKQKVEEDYWCFLTHPKHVEKPRNWLKMAGIEVYSAYYDDRDNSLFPENAAIQILSVSNHSIETSKPPFYCNIFTSSAYSSVKAYIREIWQTGWDPRDTYQIPSLITCPVPKLLDNRGDMVVSLSRKPCHNVKVGMEVVMKPDKAQKKKEDVVVCVKGLDYQNDISGRLLEWLEMQYLFGADTVSLYTFSLTSETDKVLKFYEKHRNLEVTPLELPSSPNNPKDPVKRSEFFKKDRPQKRRHELIPYNDCFYRHIHTHNYVLIIDIDEVIVPVGFDNYTSLLRNFESSTSSKYRISSISARNVFKFPSNFTLIRPYQYMISNTKRSKKTSPNGEYGKSFSSTSTVATVFNHFALHKLSPSVAKSQYFPATDAIKLHYKSECPWEESRNTCHKLEFDVVEDRSLARFEKELRRRVDDVAKKIGLWF